MFFKCSNVWFHNEMKDLQHVFQDLSFFRCANLYKLRPVSEWAGDSLRKVTCNANSQKLPKSTKISKFTKLPHVDQICRNYSKMAKLWLFPYWAKSVWKSFSFKCWYFAAFKKHIFKGFEFVVGQQHWRPVLQVTCFKNHLSSISVR